MIDVLIHSPFPQETGQGNSVTAERLLMVLSGAGIEAEIETVNYHDAADAKCLVALNAWRSASVVAEFDREHPNRQIVVVVTGSDINHPEMKNESSDTRITMERADMLVTLHDADLRVLPERLQQKSVSIYPSVSLPADLGHRALREGCFDVVMAGNLRPVKNPQLAVKIAALLPDDSPILISSYGDASAQLASEMSRANSQCRHFKWLGKLDHASLIEKMASSHVLLNTSTVEGGANAICEAVTMGLPVIASNIRGNVGMLGEDYPGLFTSESARAGLELLQRCAEEPPFYELLKKRISERASLFDFNEESSAWIDLIQSRLVL